MLIAQIQFAPWDKLYNFSVGNIEVKIGDKVVVKTELGMDVGQVVEIFEAADNEISVVANAEENEGGEASPTGKALKPIIRVATRSDIDKLPKQEEVDNAVLYCKRAADRFELPMKVVDAKFSFDNSRVTFAFIADGRVDFRELVKDLTRHFGRTIRLQQIGIRDEAKLRGDYGHCGRPLCCQGFLDELVSITSEMAEAQQCVHRGSDRISGVCGRLMCCLEYEHQGYLELAKTFPPIGSKVNVDGKRGVIVGIHILKRTVDVEFVDDKGERIGVTEVDLDRNKKK